MGTSTNGALPVPLLHVALGYNMPYLLAPIASGDAVVQVRFMENGHFNGSPSMRWEWDYSPDNPRCFNKGGSDGGVARAYREWVDKAVLVVQFLICIADLQPLFTKVQLCLHIHQLLHDLNNLPLGFPHQPLQGILEVAQATITVNFPVVFGVVNLGECHVDGKFPLVPIPQMPSLGRGHGGMSGNSPVYLDRA